MKIYRKGELRDTIIVFLVFGAVLTIATVVKNKQVENTSDTKNRSVNLISVKQQEKVME